MFKVFTSSKFLISSVMLIILSLTAIFPGCSSSKYVMNDDLKKISKYEFGQDKTHLSEFADRVRRSSNSAIEREKLEQQLIALLGSEATFAAKQFAARQLRVIGSEASLPILVKMLENSNTAAPAAFALSAIPGDEVDLTLAELLDNDSKSLKSAVINIFGERRKVINTKYLGKLLTHQDSDISAAAASSLGKTACSESAEFLRSNLNSAEPEIRDVIIDSYLLCADRALLENKTTAAYNIYKDLYSRNIPKYFKEAALAGIINSSPNSIQEIKNVLDREENTFKTVAISKLRDTADDNDILIFADMLDTLSPENQVQLIAVIEEKGNSNCRPYILKTLKSKNEEVKLAGISALSAVGDHRDVLSFAEIASHSPKKEAESARESISLLKGEKVDDEILQRIDTENDDIKIELIKAAGARDIVSAFDPIVKYTISENKGLKTAAFAALGEISSSRNLPELIDVLFAQNSASDKRKAERTINTIIGRAESKSEAARILLTSHGSTDNKMNKASVLRLLGATEGTEALNLLIEETQNQDDDIKLAAVQGLSGWDSLEPADNLAKIAESADIEKVRSAALVGFTNLISKDEKLSNKKRLELYKKSLSLAETGNEKNLALDGIGHIDDFESLDIFKSYINQPVVKKIVNDGINRVSWHLFRKNPKKVKQYVFYFLENIEDAEFQNKNTQLIEAIDRYIANN